jgi:predicted transcriptional regulator
MNATVTVTLPEELKRELDELAKEEGATPSDIVLRSISKYVLLRRFGALCAEAEAAARKQGIYTDEDVWRHLGMRR